MVAYLVTFNTTITCLMPNTVFGIVMEAPDTFYQLLHSFIDFTLKLEFLLLQVDVLYLIFDPEVQLGHMKHQNHFTNIHYNDIGIFIIIRDLLQVLKRSKQWW